MVNGASPTMPPRHPQSPPRCNNVGIILTGETGSEVQQDTLKYGLHVIHKPVTPRQLGDVLESLFAKG